MAETFPDAGLSTAFAADMLTKPDHTYVPAQVLVTGSLYIVGDTLRHLGKAPTKAL